MPKKPGKHLVKGSGTISTQCLISAGTRITGLHLFLSSELYFSLCSEVLFTINTEMPLQSCTEKKEVIQRDSQYLRGVGSGPIPYKITKLIPSIWYLFLVISLRHTIPKITFTFVMTCPNSKNNTTWREIAR